MFDSVRNNKRIVQIVLGLIAVTFAFFGIESYIKSPGRSGEVATVGGVKISQTEFAEALRDQQDRMRETLGAQFDSAMLDTPEARRSILDSLVNQKLLAIETAKSRLTIGDEQLRDFIASAPSLQENGKFSPERYQALVRARGMSEAGFEQRLRQDMAAEQLVSAITQSGLVARSLADRWMALQSEEREFAEVQFKPDQYKAQVKLDPAAVQKYYDDNRKQFETPEEVKVEYVILSADALAQDVAVSEDEIKAWYQSHQDRYQTSEERRASHILVPLVQGASEAAQKAALGKAEDLLKQVRAKPDDFAKLAKQHSLDPGSAPNGGDLGFFARGAMVKEFDDAVFKMKLGEISDLVKSEFGYHIIKLTEIKPAKGKTLDEVRGEIANELKRSAAQKQYVEAAEQFSNIVYEQSDSLKPAADKFKLKLQTSGWVSKSGQGADALNSPKLLAALFSDDSIKNKRNTEAVELAPNTLASARVLEHKPAAIRPLSEVRADIEKHLILEEAAKLAQKDGAAALEKMKKGEAVDLSWSAPRKTTREGLEGMNPEGLRELFKLPVDKLPAYASFGSPISGFSIYKLTSVATPPAKADDPKFKEAQAQMGQVLSQEDVQAYLTSLRGRYKVEINLAVLESKSPQ